MEKQLSFQQQLRHERELRGWSQADLAAQVGSDTKTVGRWERGESLPRPYLRQRLSELFGKDAEELGLIRRQAKTSRTVAPFPFDTVSESPPSPLQASLSGETPVFLEDKTPSLNEPIAAVQAGSILFQSNPIVVDWGEAPDIVNFYGREKECAQLRRWIVNDHCKIVAVLGMGGFGKTALAAQVTEQMKDTFEYIFWRSLQNAPSLAHILKQFIRFISGSHLDISEEVNEQISLLIQYLRSHRCLLILDNIETVFQVGRAAGHSREGYEGYGRLLERIGEGQHQSTLLLTSREKPKEVAHLEGKDSPVRSLYLSGVAPDEGQEILKNKELFGTPEQWKTLVHLYSGNLLALKLVAESIREVLGGDIARFLQEEEVAFGDINDLLEQQFHRLSMQEREVMCWLAIEREAVTLEDLRGDLIYPVARGTLLEALASLKRRSMIESRDAAHFTLQPVILEYVTMQLIERIGEDFDNETFGVWANYSFMKAQAKDYVRNSQIQLILAPVAQRLLATLRRQEIAQKLRNLFSLLRQMPSQKSGYVAGNALNLLVYLRSDLRSFDFSHLMIRQAYLQGVNLQEVNVVGVHFAGSVFTHPFGNILSVACSPDGELVAAGTANGEIYVFHTLTGTLYLTLYGHTDGVWSVAFDKGGRMLASSSDDQAIRLWDSGSGRSLAILPDHASRVRAISFSSDGRVFASGGDDQTVRLWDIRTGECLKILRGHRNRVWSVAFDPAGNVLASASTDGTVRLWDSTSGECLKVLEGHASWVRSIAFSADGNRLASGSDDQIICIWNSKTGEKLRRLEGHSDRIWSLAFNPRGSVLASGSEDRTVRLWNGETGQCVKILQGHAHGVRSVTFSPDGLLLISGGDDQTVRLWEAQTGECFKTLQGYTNRIWSAIFSPDGNILATSSEDQVIRLWDMNSGYSYKALQDRSHSVRTVAFSPNGNTLASGGEDSTIRLWNVQTGQCLTTFYGHTNWIRTVAFSPDGCTLASGGEDSTIRLWDVETGQCLRILDGHANWVRSVVFSPDGQMMVSGGDDQTIRLWKPHSGDCIHILQGHTNRVRAIAFSPGGRIVASGSEDQTLRLWNVETGECFKILRGHSSWVRAVAFNPDGSIIASGSEDQTLRLWDARSGECLKTLRGHANRVRWVTFDSNGERLVSSSDDGTSKLWDPHTGECLKTFMNERPYERMNITNVTGLTEAQKVSLRALGAIEER